MRGAYIFAVALVLVVLGMLFFPTIHSMIGNFDLSSELPLTQFAIILLPFAFLFFVYWAIHQLNKQ